MPKRSRKPSKNTRSSRSSAALESDSDSTLAVIHSPSSRLCGSCASLSWPLIRQPWRAVIESVPLNKTFRRLQDSADQGCLLCRFAWLSLITNYTFTTDDTELLGKGTVTLWLLVSGSYLNLWAEMGHKDELDAFKDWDSVTQFKIVMSPNDMDLVGGMKSRQIQGFTNNVEVELNKLVEQQIRPWMRDCLQQHTGHDGCGTKDMNLVLPTRLIDVGHIEDNMVRLVDVKKYSDGHEFTYLILSYCWGTGNETSKTTEVNLEARLEGLKVSELAKTIQDAILLTRTMGYRYLWVDAICIIQGSRGDFQSESSRMGDYYSNAACCISASAASDSSEGFLRPRPIARYPIETFALRIANDSGDGPKHFTFRDSNNSPIFTKALLDSSLNQRGWCLQETALSKRILHWSLQGLYLECPSSLFLEDAKIPWDRSWDNEAMPRTILARPNNDHLVTHGWCQLVSVFSETDLTYETDRLYAIHGIASLLVERLTIEYFNGHFRFGLAHGLLWYHGNTKHSSFHYRKHGEPEEVSLPSWCWASACPVQHERIRQKPIFIHDDHPKRLRQWPTRPGDTSTVKSPVSELYIRAPIIQLVIGRKNLGYMVAESSGQKVSFECSFFLDRKREVLKEVCVYGSGEEDSVLWMPVGKQLHHDTNAVVGLLIYEVPGEDKGTYRRCGVLTYVDFVNEELLMDLKEITLV